MTAENLRVGRDDRLLDPSPVQLDSDEGRRLADALEARAMTDMYAAAPAELGFRAEQVGGTTLLLAPRFPVGFFNRAIGLGLTAPATEAELDDILARYASAGAADHWIHLNPAAAPRELGGWLAARGLVPPPRRTWAKFLRGTEPYSPKPSELRVREAQPSDASAIAATVREAFDLPPPLVPWLAALVGRPGWRFVVAEADARIVAAGAVYLDGRNAWLGIGATLAAYRQRGAQNALLAARIAIAADAGCAALATETGESIAGEPNPSLANIRRAGFVQVCSRVNYAAAKR